MMRRLVTGITRLTWVTAGYGWFAIIAPILVASPGFFARRYVTRRIDDGGRGLQPGAAGAALVR